MMTIGDFFGIATVVAEGANQTHECQIGIARVIRMRMKFPREFGSDGTVIGTVLAPKQFSCWNHGSVEFRWLDNVALSDSGSVFNHAGTAWAASALSDPAWTADSYYVPNHDDSNRPGWATPGRFIVQLDRTKFYKLRKEA